MDKSIEKVITCQQIYVTLFKSGMRLYGGNVRGGVEGWQERKISPEITKKKYIGEK